MVLVGVGPRADDCKSEEETQTNKAHLFKENVRRAVAVGTKLLQGAKVKNIFVEDFNEPEGMYVCISCTTLYLFIWCHGDVFCLRLSGSQLVNILYRITYCIVRYFHGVNIFVAFIASCQVTKYLF